MDNQLDGRNNQDANKALHDDVQISLLYSLANHDLKNCIHSIDGIVSVNKPNEITQEHLDAIKYNLDVMRSILSTFPRP